MISVAAAAEDYRPTKRDILIGRGAQRAGEHHKVPMGSCNTLPKLNCLINRDQPSPSAPITPAFLCQWRNEDCFIKRDLPPMVPQYREQFHPETNVASDHQPPKATEAAVRRRLRTSTRTRSAHPKVTTGLRPAAQAPDGHLPSPSGIGPGHAVARDIRLASGRRPGPRN